MPVSKRTAGQHRVVGDTPTIDAASQADGVRLKMNLGSKVEPVLKPYWQSTCGRATVYVGDCREVMAQMPPEQFHAVVTDPPYGLGKEPDVVEVMKSWIRCGHHEVGGSGFMGKAWDAFVPQPATWQECIKVMKPGAHMLCFAGTRTLDWMGMALRFAGLECRDLVMWTYGSGFPKGINVSKAIDKALGMERSKVRTPMSQDGNVWMDGIGSQRPWKENAKLVGYHEHDGDEPATETARQWQGWNTSMKPAVEPIILARKPMGVTVAECVMQNATGALNIDGCRVGTTGTTVEKFVSSKTSSGSGVYAFNKGNEGDTTMNGEYHKQEVDGRWPANLLHDGSDEVVKLLDGGSAARFFYTAKADDNDRPHGKGKHVTTHPTVKPLDLMQYLVRLVCVRGGTVLDPFMGSGSTGCAAIVEGMRFVGIEQSQEYADLAVGRLKLTLAGMKEDTPVVPGKPVRREQGRPLPPEKV